MHSCRKAPPNGYNFTLTGCRVPTLKVEGIIAEGGYSTVYKAQSSSGAVAVKRIRLKRNPPFYDIASRYKTWRKPTQKISPQAQKELEAQQAVELQQAEEVQQAEEAQQAEEEEEEEEEGFKLTDLERIHREIRILKSCQHQFVVQLFQTFKKNDSFWMVTEFCLGDIYLIKKGETEYYPHISLPLVCHLIFPIISAVAHLCSKGFIHFDIKDENILITPQGVPKLADFGLAREYHGEPVKIERGFGTSYFMAPEMIRHDCYNLSYDTWSIAMTILHMLRGKRFAFKLSYPEIEKMYLDYEIGNEKDKDFMIKKFNLGTPDAEFCTNLLGELHPEFRLFMIDLLEFDWRKRLTPVQVCELPFAAKILKSWEEGEKSEFYRDNQKELFELLEFYSCRQKPHTKKSEENELNPQV